jgi:phospholipid-binding lipoprotein MlaA
MRANKVVAILLTAVMVLFDFNYVAWAAGKPTASTVASTQDKASGGDATDKQGLDYLKDDYDTEVAEISDPFENVNRKVFHFNDKFYFAVAKPVATGYRKALPEGARLSVRNFIDVLESPIRFGSCLLQANFRGALIEFMRTTINVTAGIGGLFDPATAIDLPKQPEDMGQTLAVWGIGPGPYIVWPFVGPSSLRRTVGYLGDTLLNPFTYIGLFWWIPFAEVPVRELNQLSFHLGEYESFKAAALDPYVSMRDAYTAFRNEQIKQRGVLPATDATIAK